MLSRDLRRLHETFRAWGLTTSLPTLEQWIEFQAELKDAYIRAAMLELGLNLDAVLNMRDVVADSDGKVVLLRPNQPRVVPIGDGGQR